MVKRKKKKGAQRSRPGVKLLLLLAVAGLMVYGVKYTWQRARVLPYFRCRTITVRGNGLVSGEELLNGIRPDTAKTVFEYDLAALADSVARHPYVSGCVAGRRIPSGLQVRIQERQPVAYVNAGTMYLVDSDFYVLPLPRRSVSLDLPILTGIPNLKPGDRRDVALLKEGLGFLASLTELEPGLVGRISEIDLSVRDGYRIRTVRPEMTVLVNRDKVGELAEKWRIIENYARSDRSKIRYIDLRYRDQIIVKKRT